MMEMRPARRLRDLLLMGMAGGVFIWLSAGQPIPLGSEVAAMQNTSSFLIDDFSGEDGASAVGTKWRMFTDQVMGGVSEATYGWETVEGSRCLRLRGRVSLKNNGGFVQVALPLTGSGQPFDAGEYKGLRVRARGNGKTYHVHLRTAETRQPWQYYSAGFAAGSGWNSVEIPFDRFKPENLRAKLDTKKLERIAVVAIGEEFDADIAVARLEFFR